jgi:outer membrane receptor for ferrienterochelin and colicins
MTPIASNASTTLLFTALLLGQIAGANAADKHLDSELSYLIDTKNLGQHVITGTRTQKLVIDSPVKVQVITQDEIRLKNAKDLKEAIEDVPGIVLRKIHGKSGYEVSMQGIDAKRVLVLVDGERVARSSNGISDLSQIGVSNIQQIEIVKGATSALYGSNAIGGVINVITSIPNQAVRYSIKGDIGSHFNQNLAETDLELSTASSSGTLNLKQGRWDAALNYDLRETEGFELYPSTWKHEGDHKSKLNTSAMLGFNPDISQRYFLSSEYYQEDVTSKFFGTGPNHSLYKKTEQANRYTHKAGYDLQSKDHGLLKIRYFYEAMKDVTSQDVVTTSLLEQKRENLSSEQKLTFQWDMDVARNCGTKEMEPE